MPAIRLVPFANQESNDSRLYLRSHCGFCGRVVMDRRDVRPDEPPAACPKCSDLWHQSPIEFERMRIEDPKLFARKVK